MLGINNLIANLYMVATEVVMTATNASSSTKAAIKASQVAVGGATGSAEVVAVASVGMAQEMLDAAGVEMEGPVKQVMNTTAQAGATIATGGANSANLAMAAVQVASTGGGAALELAGVEGGGAVGMLGGVVAGGAGGAAGNVDWSQTMRQAGGAVIGGAAGAGISAATGGDTESILNGAGAGAKVGTQAAGIGSDLSGLTEGSWDAPPVAPGQNAPSTTTPAVPPPGAPGVGPLANPTPMTNQTDSVEGPPDQPQANPPTGQPIAGAEPTAQDSLTESPDSQPQQSTKPDVQDRRDIVDPEERGINGAIDLAAGGVASAVIYKRAEDTGKGDASQAIRHGTNLKVAELGNGENWDTTSPDGNRAPPAATTVGEAMQQGGNVMAALNYTELEAKAEGKEQGGMDGSKLRQQAADRGTLSQAINSGYRQSIAHTDQPENDKGFTLAELWERMT